MLRRVISWILIFFILINIVAFIHAYKFTHFSSNEVDRTKDPKELSAFSKFKILLTGIDNPKPKNRAVPSNTYQTLTIEGSTYKLECWSLKTINAKGTVILYHGYSGEKSSLLKRSEEFLSLGYNTFLVDFVGSGGSTGNQTSIGFNESEQVKRCYDFVLSSGEENVILFGTSMGAVAILKALGDFSFKPLAVILECPFGSLYKTVCARFNLMGLPCFPMAGLLSFWGGIQNGYWAFSHNPYNYAKSVTCPVLLLFGESDDRVTIEETMLIYDNLKGPKFLKTYSGVGHDIFVETNQNQWVDDVSNFIQKVE